MAAYAFGGCAPVNIVDVTLLALHLNVLAREFERRQVVIEDLRLPAFTVMTAGTVSPKVDRVRIIFQVAALTIDGSFLKTG
jgi:hypothetical protein